MNASHGWRSIIEVARCFSPRSEYLECSKHGLKHRATPGAIIALVILASLLTYTNARAADMPAGHPTVAQPVSASDLQFFESKIRPLLIDQCYKCHSKE